MANMFVPEPLENGNYERWSKYMKNYLISKDFWDVIQLKRKPPSVDEKEWKIKDAAALDVIWKSCDQENLNRISDCSIDSARVAWVKLESIHKKDDSVLPLPHSLLDIQGNTLEIHEEEEKDDSVHEEEVDSGQLNGPTNLTSNNVLEIHEEEINDSGIPTDAEKTSLKNSIEDGDLDALEMFFGKYERKAAKAKIDEWGHTALHVATICGRLIIVEGLLKIITTEDTEMLDFSGKTALHHAAEMGKTEIVKSLVCNNPNLLAIGGRARLIPLVSAYLYGPKDVKEFLYSRTSTEILSDENGKQAFELVIRCVETNAFDIALDVLHRCPKIVEQRWENCVLGFAKRPEVFASGTSLTFWQQWIYDCLKVDKPSFPAPGDSCVTFTQPKDEPSLPAPGDSCVTTTQPKSDFEKKISGRLWRWGSILLPFLGIKKLYYLKLSHACARQSLHFICQHISTSQSRVERCATNLGTEIFEAIENGFVEFLTEIGEIIKFTDQVKDDTGRNVFMAAIAYRQDKISRFLNGLQREKKVNFIRWGPDADMLRKDIFENNVLHIAAHLAPDFQLTRFSDAALQMQREVQWFKEVETICCSAVQEGDKRNDPRYQKNKAGETPIQVFTKEHKGLLQKAEEWMKHTAASYTVVAALIITIMFPAAFTLPGGHDQDTGFPTFKNETAFKIYIISDAISLFAATTSVLMFLGILTSRYYMEDFRKSLPQKLIIGLSTLFISIAGMMVAFCSALFLTVQGQLGVIISITLLAGIPVTLFVLLQFPPLIGIYITTYRSPIFGETRSLASKIKAIFTAFFTALFTRKKKIL